MEIIQQPWFWITGGVLILAVSWVITDWACNRLRDGQEISSKTFKSYMGSTNGRTFKQEDIGELSRTVRG